MILKNRVLTARRKVEVSLRTVTSRDAVPLTTHTPVPEKAQPWASSGGATLVFVAASRSRGLDQRVSQPVAAAVRRAAAASMDPPDAPQPLPSARSKFDAVPHAQPSGASFALSAGTSAPACTLASACVAASCHQAPCRPPLADVRGRARCFLESTAPHQQSTTHAKPPGTIE